MFLPGAKFAEGPGATILPLWDVESEDRPDASRVVSLATIGASTFCGRTLGFPRADMDFSRPRSNGSLYLSAGQPACVRIHCSSEGLATCSRACRVLHNPHFVGKWLSRWPGPILLDALAIHGWSDTCWRRKHVITPSDRVIGLTRTLSRVLLGRR